MPTILVVDDDAVSCQLLAEVLERDGLTAVWDTDPHAALERVGVGPIDLAVVDIRMPQMSGLELLRRLRVRLPDLPVIVMTGFGSVDTAVDAIASGAVDYVSKPMNVDEIRASVRRALSRHQAAEAAIAVDRSEVAGMVGTTAAMVDVYRTIARVAPGRSTVLILGESGTGKELVARAIHAHSPRRDRPFLAVDCTAMVETLLESELFGYVRGAFTGAVRDHPGIFAEAEGGTLFLDEIGDVSPGLQAKLLRALQEQQVRAVGSSQWRPVDVRVVAATNRDLEAAVATGRFREDLYYRLKVVTITLPPLRDRREDIPLLVHHLMQRAARQCGKSIAGVTDGALTVLRTYAWPGNIRELAHVLERSVALAHHEVIDLDDLSEDVRAPNRPETTDLLSDRPSLEELKRRYIRQVLEESSHNITRAAAVLGIDRRSLYRMLQRHGIPHRAQSDE